MKFFRFKATQKPPDETSRHFRSDMLILGEVCYMEAVSELFKLKEKEINLGIFSKTEVVEGFEQHSGVIVANNLAEAIEMKNIYSINSRQPIEGFAEPQLN